MALIQGQKAVRASPSSKDNERCVRKADPKIPVTTDHLRSLLHVLRSEALESIRASRDLAQKEQFRCWTDPFQQ